MHNSSPIGRPYNLYPLMLKKFEWRNRQSYNQPVLLLYSKPMQLKRLSGWKNFCKTVIEGNIISDRKPFRMSDLLRKYKEYCPEDPAQRS